MKRRGGDFINGSAQKKDAQLVGESEPIEIEISRYNLNGKGDQLQLTVEAATTSREWVSAALREFVVGREFSIPKPAGAFLKLLS